MPIYISKRTLIQVLSAILSFAVYTALLNWKIAIIAIVGIGFHEGCHLLAAKKLRLKTGGMIFIPFLGGISHVQGPYETYVQNVIVALAGPIGGGLLSFVAFLAYLHTGSHVLGGAAYLLALMNLFNLSPVSDLDGGQVINSIARSINRKAGLVFYIVTTFLAAVFLVRIVPGVVVFLIIFGYMSIRRELRNLKYLEQGKSWLCDESFLHPPAKLTAEQMILVFEVWFLAVSLLFGLTTHLNSIPEASLANLFTH